MSMFLYLKGVISGVPTEYVPSSFLLSTWVASVELLHLSHQFLLLENVFKRLEILSSYYEDTEL